MCKLLSYYLSIFKFIFQIQVYKKDYLSSPIIKYYYTIDQSICIYIQT